MHSISITAQSLAILKTYAMRPLMWLACLIVGFGCFALLSQSRSIHFRDAFPSPFVQDGPGVLDDGEMFLRWVSDGTVHPEITAIDFISMGSTISLKNKDPVTRRAELRLFSELQHALVQFPNVQTLRFDTQQLIYVEPETLAALPKLHSVLVRDLPITARHVNLLAGIESLEYLELQTTDLPASLQPLEELPKLATVVISSGYYIMTDRPAVSPYSRQTLSELRELPALQRIALKPPYVPGIGYFAGSDEPDPSCDPILKENVAELLGGHPRLTYLWVGANQREEEREHLKVIADALPNANVNAATYDSSKVMKAGGGATALLVAMGLVVLQLTSQFSSHASQLVPGFARRHLAVAGLLVILALLTMVVSVLKHEISMLAALAVFTTSLAIVLALNVWWDSMMTSPQRWTQYIPAAIVLCIALIPMWSEHLPPQYFQWMDQFLIGSYPLVACVILVGSIAVTVSGLLRFVGLHRVWAELSLEPAMTLKEFNERSTSLALRRLGDDNLLASMAGWERALQAASARLQQGSWLALCRMWQLGQPPTKFVRVIVAVILISCVSVYIANIRPTYSPQVAVHYALFFVVYIGLVITAMGCLGRSSALPLDLLHPVSRRDLITSAFATVFVQVAAVTCLALLVAWIQRTILIDVPSAASLLRGVAAMGGADGADHGHDPVGDVEPQDCECCVGHPAEHVHHLPGLSGSHRHRNRGVTCCCRRGASRVALRSSAPRPVAAGRHHAGTHLQVLDAS